MAKAYTTAKRELEVALAGPWPQAKLSGGGPDLSGEWSITIKSKHTFPSSMTTLGRGMYRLSKAGVFSGIYEMRGNELTWAKPDNPKAAGFVWQMENESRLVLIDQPEVGQVSSGSYIPTVMERPCAQTDRRAEQAGQSNESHDETSRHKAIDRNADKK